MGEHLASLLGCVPSSNPPSEKDQPNFVFEIRIYFELLAKLKANGFSLTPASKQLELARAPTAKAHVTPIEVERNGIAWQIVQGAEIEDRYGDLRAADFSVQAGGADRSRNAKAGEVIGIWDAKLCGAKGEPVEGALPRREMDAFLHWMSTIQIPHPKDQAPSLENWPAPFSVSSLITNRTRPTTQWASLLAHGASTVEHYAGADSPPSPTRHEHCAHK